MWCLSCHCRTERSLTRRAPALTAEVLSAGRGRPARTPFTFLVWTSPVVVPASKCGVCCLSLVDPQICWLVDGTRDISVEALFPEGRERFELDSPGWSRVLGIDAVGGSPHGDLGNKCGARVTSWCSPNWLGLTLAGLVLDLLGEIGDKLGSPCQVVAPDARGFERCWNAWEPGQRTPVGWRERCEAPVEHGRHIVCGSEVTPAGGLQQVAESMLSRFSRQCDQVGSKVWPGGFSGESGNVLVGLVQLCDCLGSEELFGSDVEAVGVALDRLEKPGRWIVELAQHSAGRDRRLIAGEDLLQRLSRRAG